MIGYKDEASPQYVLSGFIHLPVLGKSLVDLFTWRPTSDTSAGRPRENV